MLTLLVYEAKRRRNILFYTKTKMSEEENLEDFFAKRDKNKKTKKKKKVKSSETSETQVGEVSAKTQGGDEWNDFEERKEKDYSSLKIQDLRVTEEPVREDVEEEVVDNDCLDGEKVTTERQTIWKTNPGVVSKQQKPAAAISTPNVVGGKYVPPSLKRAAMGSDMPRRMGVPPDIKSQTAFPTLGAANQDLSSAKMPSDFEMVKKGTRTNDARLNETRPTLNLDNRYDGLKS